MVKIAGTLVVQKVARSKETLDKGTPKYLKITGVEPETRQNFVIYSFKTVPVFPGDIITFDGVITRTNSGKTAIVVPADTGTLLVVSTPQTAGAASIPTDPEDVFEAAEMKRYMITHLTELGEFLYDAKIYSYGSGEIQLGTEELATLIKDILQKNSYKFIENVLAITLLDTNIDDALKLAAVLGELFAKLAPGKSAVIEHYRKRAATSAA